VNHRELLSFMHELVHDFEHSKKSIGKGEKYKVSFYVLGDREDKDRGYLAEVIFSPLKYVEDRKDLCYECNCNWVHGMQTGRITPDSPFVTPFVPKKGRCVACGKKITDKPRKGKWVWKPCKEVS
jgi:hypothetical protein